LRFLFDWQRVSADARMEGPDAIPAVIEQLEGFEAPAGAWESEILPARILDYEPEWFDDQCLAGRLSWARLRSRRASLESERRPSPVRSTPITLLARRNASLWSSISPAPAGAPPSPAGVRVADFLRENGASFFQEIVEGARLLRTQAEQALAELVALGIVTSDSFGGLRALLVPAEKRQAMSGKRRRRASSFGMEAAGRWALARRTPQATQPLGGGFATTGRQTDPDAVEHIACTLLRRYGVVFWRLLEREADWLPPWRDLLHVYRRLEARGEIRGGRFVSGFSGEQFALPEAVGHLREVRRRPHDGALLSISGADPLNLSGILTPGPKLPALTGNRAVYRDGLPVALSSGGREQYLEALDDSARWAVRKALLKGPAPARLAELA
jgi:ATP-dependent Lhr-like helicase